MHGVDGSIVIPFQLENFGYHVLKSKKDLRRKKNKSKIRFNKKKKEKKKTNLHLFYFLKIILI